MNYLAHLFLSDQTSDGFAGSLLGDFITGRVAGRFNQKIESEITLHRKIDAFTDADAIVKRSKARISPEISRFAGVLIDVFYDHFLAVDFEKYSNVPLKTFTEKAYRALEEHRDLFPDAFRQRIPAIIQSDLLGSYKSLDGIGIALRRISGRIKRENSLPDGIFDLENNYRQLKTDFQEYFPKLTAFVQTARND
ncbi:MAG TPA: ACP phosphodiesterase [Pyrinomonadaceae bacterium]|jgi:acyl carrier protein phosphodiesterase